MDADTTCATRPDTLLLQEQLCFALYSASHAVARRYRPMLEAIGLTYPQYLCMLVLWEEDGLTVRALGERLHLDSGTITPLLKRLESAGLVRRQRDREDERQVRITLSERAQSMRATAATVPEAMICAMGLDALELEGLREDLLRLRDRLDRG